MRRCKENQRNNNPEDSKCHAIAIFYNDTSRKRVVLYKVYRAKATFSTIGLRLYLITYSSTTSCKHEPTTIVFAGDLRPASTLYSNRQPITLKRLKLRQEKSTSLE